jgi:polysaccharide biosynthesis/export protein
VIDVSVPEIDELQNQKVRVSARGQIELPLIGSVEAAGLGENELHDALVEKLKVYMKTPRVELFVENYRSRGVAIMGAVQKPGFYDMADEQESLEAMIGLAGGLSSAAAQKVIFAPVQTARIEAMTASAAQAVSFSPTDEGPSSSLDAVHSIVLDLDTGGDAACLNLPARPGDAIIVPTAGQVMVEGWVQNPGAFAITPGMTVLGAVSAAGGPVFSWWAELIRTDGLGGKTISHYTLSRLESGEEHDPPVDSGDVVLVEKTVVGAVPYALYSLFEHFGTGIALPMF